MEIIANFLNPYVFIGSEGILVEGIRRVGKWQNECIEVESADKVLTICGERLKMEYKSMDSLLVKGRIEKIEFRRSRR
ncbi:MAG: YabP/YqfC family sporulation protein [Clostridia bacterium]|nr:YabP/YqfC family sporulation protein [Clostridia bacterium]